MKNPWWKSRGMWSGVLTIALFMISFVVGLFRGGPLQEVAEDAAKVVAVFSPILAGLAVLGIRGALSVFLVMGLAVGTVACQIPGDDASGGSGAGGGSAAGGYVVGGQQEASAGTNIAVGGNQYIRIIPKPGVVVPDSITAAIAKVLGSEVPIEAKERLLDTMARLYGFTIEIKIDDSGNADNAGTTGRSGIPSENEPDKPKPDEGDGL